MWFLIIVGFVTLIMSVERVASYAAKRHIETQRRLQKPTLEERWRQLSDG